MADSQSTHTEHELSSQVPDLGLARIPGCLEFKPDEIHDFCLEREFGRIGWIYAIHAKEVGRLKIGFTSGDPSGRLSQLQTGSPVDLVVSGYRPGFQSQESAIHSALAEYRTHGEWFDVRGDVFTIWEQMAICKGVRIRGDIAEYQARLHKAARIVSGICGCCSAVNTALEHAVKMPVLCKDADVCNGITRYELTEMAVFGWIESHHEMSLRMTPVKLMKEIEAIRAILYAVAYPCTCFDSEGNRNA